jgi:hypothetical protein
MQCCSDGHLTLNGSFERRIRTSPGEFKMDFWRVRCSKCGKTFVTWAKFIGKIARIILKRFTNANVWEDYWQNKMNCAGNVIINIGKYKCFSQNLDYLLLFLYGVAA